MHQHRLMAGLRPDPLGELKRVPPGSLAAVGAMEGNTAQLGALCGEEGVGGSAWKGRR